MEIVNVTKELENPLFKRKEVEILVSSESVPSHLDAKKALSEKFSTKPEAIRIKKIAGRFGTKEFNISANVYVSPQDKEATEIMSKKEKDKEKPQTEKPQETKQEEKPEEKPVEEPIKEVNDKDTSSEQAESTVNDKEKSEPSSEAKE